MTHRRHCRTPLAPRKIGAWPRSLALADVMVSGSTNARFFDGRLRMRSVRSENGEMAKNAKHQRAADRSKRLSARVIPLDQVSPAVLTASRDVAYILEQFCFSPEPEDLLKAVLERAEHLEQQAMGITVLED